MKKTFLIVTTLLALGACSSQPTSEMATEKVEVSQMGDSKLDCQQLDKQTQQIEANVKTMVQQKKDRENESFTASAATDLVLSLLAGSANAGNRTDRTALTGFSQQEQARIDSMAQRHHHLLIIAKEKNCAFVTATEARIEKYKQQNQRPIESQPHRQRMANQ